MFEVILDNRDGTMWNISELITSITWKTSRIGKAGSVDITFVDDPYWRNESFRFEVGNIVRVKKGETPLILAYIFEVSEGLDRKVTLKCYDQTRYLMASDHYVEVNVTATEVIKTLAGRLELKVGDLADTKYIIPKISEDAQKMMDIICKALTETMTATLETFVFYDDFGELVLKSLQDMKVDRLVLGDNAQVSDYSKSVSIDNDTYNYIILAQDDKKAGIRNLYKAQDSSTIAKWGRLQVYDTVDEKYNVEQIKQLLDARIKLSNRPTRKLSITALGDARIRAGSSFRLQLSAIGVDSDAVVTECTHKFEGNEHTMSLEVVVRE
ncbi:hypothetical protein [Paenibacillus sp. GCM10027626]|uniref:XkdQ/YqbQ family protein n=1 Tax=Paenibacillus sp. GCM10027626 TaxID=3273411 RepID=UPI0036277489